MNNILLSEVINNTSCFNCNTYFCRCEYKFIVSLKNSFYFRINGILIGVFNIKKFIENSFEVDIGFTSFKIEDVPISKLIEKIEGYLIFK